nr:reverse transcriptase [Tanacetum cinerariifolium]
MSTPTQLKWLPKLIGFDSEIQYKKGVENVTTDALSRLQSSRRLVVGNDQSLKTELLKQFYKGLMGGHSGVRTTTNKICNLAAYPGLLQPLPMSTRIWSNISMDFIDSLPKSQGKTVILVVVDREQPKNWMKWLSLAEWRYNTNHHSAINTTPYEIVYGQSPPIHVPYIGGDSRVESVDRSLTAREEAIE